MKKFRRYCLCTILTSMLMFANVFVYAESQRAETKGYLTCPSSMINILISEKTEESVEITEITEKYETPHGVKEAAVKVLKGDEKKNHGRGYMPRTGDCHALLTYLLILVISGGLLSAIKYDRDCSEIS